MTARDTVLVRDTFADDQPRGRVIGTHARCGTVRTGRDLDGQLGIDHGALRITSLPKPGWGRATLSYGPFAPEPGLAVGALVLNGHNASQTGELTESLPSRMKRWLKGNETEPWLAHGWAWLRHGRRRWTLGRFRYWWSVDRQARRGSLSTLDESLSVGLLPGETSADPIGAGHSFVIHSANDQNGELWVSDRGGPRRVVPSVQNVPLFLMAVVRDDDVIHYAASLDGARGFPSLPAVRPLAIVARSAATPMHAAVQQAVSGQIGFGVDTRVFGAAVARVSNWSAGPGAPLLQAALANLAPGDARAWALGQPAGLIRVTAAPGAEFTLSWREQAPRARWILDVSRKHVRLARATDGGRETVLRTEGQGDGLIDVQVTDDGSRIGVHVGHHLMFDRWLDDPRDTGATGVSLALASGRVEALEVHGRTVPAPTALRFDPPAIPTTAGLAVDEDFSNRAGDLEGTAAGPGGAVWHRTQGSGHILATGDGGARVDATAAQPLSGRTEYTIPWTDAGPVELEIDVVPPGTARGQSERGRAGIVFRADADNALTVATWLDDAYDGTSVSSFFRLSGFEDLYDAVWTNVGRRIHWGQPYRLRVAFDGLVYAAYVDDELVLYRSLVDIDPDCSRLRIARVGIVANWEWGTDTGSVFRRFTARTARTTGTRSADERPTELTRGITS